MYGNSVYIFYTYIIIFAAAASSSVVVAYLCCGSPSACFIMEIIGASNASETTKAIEYVTTKCAQNSHVCAEKK